MKKTTFNLLKVIAFAAYFFWLAACRKDDKPTVYGHWETVNAVGFNWEYVITKDAQLCKRLPEYFPDTSFCFDFDVDGDVVTVHAPTVETWHWEFVADDVADVNVTLAGGEKQRFILKRIN